MNPNFRSGYQYSILKSAFPTVLNSLKMLLYKKVFLRGLGIHAENILASVLKSQKENRG